jgi:hypothetical protein
MHSKRFEFEYRGKWQTINTTQNAMGAFWRATGERPTEWVELNRWETLVNGCLVREIRL